MHSKTSNQSSRLPTLCKSSLPPLPRGEHLSVLFVRFSQTWTPSHTLVMDMEIQFLHETFTGKGPKLLMNHIRRMGTGEVPFFSTTLSLVFDRLVEKASARSVPSGSGSGKSTEIQDTAVHTTLPQASTSAFQTPVVSTSAFPTFWASVSASSSSRPPVPTPVPVSRSVPSSNQPPLAWLVCNKCGRRASSAGLYQGLRCPKCPSRSVKKGRPYMYCQLCGNVRAKARAKCTTKACRATFR